MATNVCNPYFRPGADLTVMVSENVKGKTFLRVDTGYDIPLGKLPVCKTATDATALFGVAAFDGKPGEYVHVIVTDAMIPVTSGGALNIGDYVTVGAGGKAVKAASRAEAVGICLFSVTTADVDVAVKLF